MMLVYNFMEEEILQMHQQRVSVEEITADLMKHLKERPEKVTSM